ncbi:threonine synthase [Thermoflexus sp.]|uniref:threonine synthase n=1 Tax=Thermoflexus sp. TaxID=1969742 RepID=UPI002608C116|nr:threonine synthase [Thermoflexus sp.]MCX7691626.1 threonine synthase [Thermoflexus sp.]
MFAIGFRCGRCGATYDLDEVRYVCPRDGPEGTLDVLYDYERLRATTSPARLEEHPSRSIWRYAPLLPLRPETLRWVEGAGVLQAVGWTPLYRAERTARRLGLRAVYIKDDGRNPTASFKDRASAVVALKAIEEGVSTITTASSGNAAAALAGMAAALDLRAIIFVPHTAPEAKVAQLLIYGARVFLVEGAYDEAFDLTLAAAEAFGWYCRNTAYNPFTREGKKTAAYEIWEQMGGRVPDRLFVSVGDGNILTGLWKGFRDLTALGWIERPPILMGVQAEGAAVLARAWAEGREDIRPEMPHTIADSIAVGQPRDARFALRAVRETGGAFLTVADEEILAAMRTLAQEAGVFAEPAAAAAFAGLEKAVREGLMREEETVLVMITGNGLKDIPSAMRAVGHAARISAEIPTALRQLREAIR